MPFIGWTPLLWRRSIIVSDEGDRPEAGEVHAKHIISPSHIHLIANVRRHCFWLVPRASPRFLKENGALVNLLGLSDDFAGALRVPLERFDLNPTGGFGAEPRRESSDGHGADTRIGEHVDQNAGGDFGGPLGDNFQVLGVRVGWGITRGNSIHEDGDEKVGGGEDSTL